METDIMRMQREAEQRVRELREQERRAAHTGEPRGRTARGLFFYKEEAAVPRWIRREGNRLSPGPVRLYHGTCGPVPEPE